MNNPEMQFRIEDFKSVVLTPIPYEVGNQYRTQEGKLVRFVAVHNQGTSYETMEDEDGVNRYTRRDFGRVTGTDHEYSDPRNVPPHYSISNSHDLEVVMGESVEGLILNKAQ